MQNQYKRVSDEKHKIISNLILILSPALTIAALMAGQKVEAHYLITRPGIPIIQDLNNNNTIILRVMMA